MMVAVALLGLLTLRKELKAAGTLKLIRNISLRSVTSSSITGKATEDVDEPAANEAVKGLDTKSTPPPKNTRLLDKKYK